MLRLWLILVALLLVACGGGGAGSGDSGVKTTYTLTGEIKTLSGIVFDHDVNDPDASYASNDDVSLAQFLPSPFTLGGYLNLPRKGQSGRSYEQGDLKDYYRLRLIRDQVITLNTVDPDSGRLAIRLYTTDGSQRLVTAVNNSSISKSLIANSDGEFILEVEVMSGATAYTLTTGISQISVRENRSANIIPGEILVRFDPATGKTNRSSMIKSLDLETQKELGSGLVLLSMNNATGRSSTGSLEEKTFDVIDRLNNTPGVVYAEPNYLLTAYQEPNDPLFSLQWHYPIVNLPAAWDLETGSDAVIVAVIDTGILRGHPDLQANLLPGYDFITDLDRAADGDGPDADPADPGEIDNPEKSASFHGTHVAGVIAASANNNQGVAGSAWGIRVMPLRALGALDGSVADVADAIRYAAGLANSTGQLPPQRAEIINLSLGTTDFSQVLADAVTAARDAGVIILAAAGNESTTTHHYPAAFPEVISVNAIDSTGLRASYSNVGPTIDITAPGGDDQDNNGDGFPDAILSTLGDANGKRSYELLKGTSMACAHVSGIVGLMESIYQRNNMDLSPARLEDFLLSGRLTQDKGATGWDEIYGYGLMDAYQSVSAAIEEVTNTLPPALSPRLSVSPASLNFGTSGVEGEITLSNQGGDTPGFVVVSASSDQDWLQVIKVDEPGSAESAAGLGKYRIIADRQHSQLQEDDLYRATINFNGNEPNQVADISLAVYLQVSSVAGAADAGSQHVNLVDVNTAVIVQTLIVNPESGNYHFEFIDVPKGRYQINSYTDADNNAQPCETGEACGAYPTLSGVSQVNVDSNLNNLDFTTSLSLDVF